jgi:hypothetical protein
VGSKKGDADGAAPPRKSARCPRKILSGGQTGVDRAALDAAIALGIPHGGWCPRGRRAEDGRIPSRYALAETDSPVYAVRTERNVLDADATLILCRGPLRGGTALTRRFAQQHGKPYLVVNLDHPPDNAEIHRWLRESRIGVCNVAGPRESQSPGIYALARRYLEALFGQRR